MLAPIEHADEGRVVMQAVPELNQNFRLSCLSEDTFAFRARACTVYLTRRAQAKVGLREHLANYRLALVPVLFPWFLTGNDRNGAGPDRKRPLYYRSLGHNYVGSL